MRSRDRTSDHAPAGVGAAPTAVGAAPTVASSAAPGGQTTVTLMGWGGIDNPPETNFGVVMKQQFPELAAKYKLQGISGGKGDFEMADKLRLILAAGGSELPDATVFNYTQLAEWSSTGELFEQESYMAPYKDDLTKGTAIVSQYGGKTWGYPVDVKSKVAYYRSDLLDQAGLKWSDFKTGDDFIAGAREFHTKLPQSYLLNLGPSPAQYWIDMLLGAYVPDVTIADAQGNYQLTSNPAFGQVFETIKKLQAIAAPIDDFSQDWPQGFESSTIAGVLLAVWFPIFLPKYAPKQKGLWKIDQWPAFNGKTGGSESGGSLITVWKRSKNKEAASEIFSKVMVSKPGVTGRVLLFGSIPLIKSVQAEAKQLFPQYKPPAGTDPDTFLTNYFGLDALDPIFASYDSFKVLPYDLHDNQEKKIMKEWLVKYLNGTPLAEALKGAQSDMESQIGNPNKP